MSATATAGAITVAAALAAGSRRLQSCSDSPRLDAELLIAGLLQLSRSQLSARADRMLDEVQQSTLEAQLARREQGEPIAYLLGSQGFWTLELRVTPDVLVPRPDTETLVEWACERIAADIEADVADLGTGSGAIALAIARERPRARVLATDASVAALAVAQDNASRNALGNVRFAQGDWFAAVDGGFDLIVSNPPYIAVGDPHLPALRHEPLSALTDGADGLRCLRTIIDGAPAHLKADGWLLVEHGYDQGEAVRELFERAGYAQVQTRRDLGQNERATGGRWGAP